MQYFFVEDGSLGFAYFCVIMISMEQILPDLSRKFFNVLIVQFQ